MANKNESAIDKIRGLVKTKGYLYALLMIAFEDFHVNIEKIHEVDRRRRVSTKEIAMLFGFLTQNKMDFSKPDTHIDLINLKNKTYELLEDLHQSLIVPFFEKMRKEIGQDIHNDDYRKSQKDFFGHGEMFVESIFYSGTGVYDFQYSDFLEKKYRYDKDWLLLNKKFDILRSKKILNKIKEILQTKSEVVKLCELRDDEGEILEKIKNKYPNIDHEKEMKDVLPLLDIYQYVELFFDKNFLNGGTKIDQIREDGWNSFYNGLLELFIIRKSDFEDDDQVGDFLDNFSIDIDRQNLNDQFKEPGNYNIINSHPIIKLDQERYLITVSYLLFEAVYESPFYWMWTEGVEYKGQLSKNRGRASEEIVFEYLSVIFNDKNIFKDVKIKSLESAEATVKTKDDTDIDVLCILGSKALCVQVKSKKLTELSRVGDDNQLKKDFKEAVQDAYEQASLSRKKILDRKSKFIDSCGQEIQIPESIDEVYLMVVTTENYPALTHQTSILLDKDDNNPFPIVLTVFDLELLTFYLTDPYDFLYYVRQRITLMDYFLADEEIVFLGYHINQKLYKPSNDSHVAIDADFGQLIDRNYYPIKAGIKVSDDGDVIKNKWKNEDFDLLCKTIKSLNQPKITDILFNLFDFSSDSIDSLIGFINSVKQKTLLDGKNHDFSMPPNKNSFPMVGITYFSLGSNNPEELKVKLLTLCEARKYKSRGDIWIGLGSIKDSKNIIDGIAYNDDKWEYDKEMEDICLNIFGHGDGRAKFVNLNKKLGRNDKCPCGSGLKYKKCCLK